MPGPGDRVGAVIRLAAALVVPVAAVAATVVWGPDVLGGHDQLAISTIVAEAVPPGAPDDLSAPAPGATRKAATGTRATPRRTPLVVDDDPLRVTIRSLSPAVIPHRGKVTIKGTVVNRSSDAWFEPKVYPINSAFPMTSAAELREAAALDPTVFVGQRITSPDVFVDLPDLRPGDRARFTIKVPRDELDSNALSGQPGVYWIGAQVLAGDENGVRDGLAKGRARTFIPLLGDRADPVVTSLVVPLRASTLRDDDGVVADTDGWAEQLAPGGRLANLVDFVAAAGSAPVTWLVDPAVLDTVQRLADGNPRRSLKPTVAPDADAPAADDPLALTAQAWLDRTTASLASHRVLALPYGDLDVASATRNLPELYTAARDLSADRLDELGADARPAVVPPSGQLDAQALPALSGDDVLLSDAALPDDGAGEAGPPTTVQVDDQAVGVYDGSLTTTATGRAIDAVSLRQRILAEAAVRSLARGDRDLLVVLPPDFDPGRSPQEFFEGLDQEFVELLSTSSPVATDDTREVNALAYPDRESEAELSTSALDTARSLTDAGETLDRLLPDNDTIGRELRAEALASTSYLVRDEPFEAALAASSALDWVDTQLGRVTIDAPEFVILSARSGPFAVTVRNRLDQPVAVQIRATRNPRLVIEAPEEIELAPDSQRTVNLSAQAGSIGVHSVRLLVTDKSGQPLGSEVEVSIRSNQVGRVIWVIMGGGVGILFLAIAVRLVRRVRAARAA